MATRTVGALKTARPQAEKLKITLFHCFNALKDGASLDTRDAEVESVRMPCSSMTREVFLLRAFEAGADAVAVVVCPIGACRYGEGNLRARKRVERMKKLLDEIGLDGSRLNIYHVEQGDEAQVRQIIDQVSAELSVLGPNPAA